MISQDRLVVHAARLAVWMLCLLGAGCTAAPATSAPAAASQGQEMLRVVTTVAPITNMVYNVSGDLVALQGLVPPGVNAHTFEPAPSDARILAEADIVFLNGLQLETPVMDLMDGLAAGPTVVSLGDLALAPDAWVFDFSFPESGAKPNPHLWMNPVLAMAYVEAIRDVLVAADPAHAAQYRAHAEAYGQRLAELDAALAAAVDTIPPANRKLLTYHDSWAYFAARYGLTVIGAIQPSDMTEPSARELAALIGQIREENVPAVFGAREFPSVTLEAIARETGAVLNDQLADDVLPAAPGDPRHTYVGMILRNVRIITEALGGDASVLDTVDPANVPVATAP